MPGVNLVRSGARLAWSVKLFRQKNITYHNVYLDTELIPFWWFVCHLHSHWFPLFLSSTPASPSSLSPTRLVRHVRYPRSGRIYDRRDVFQISRVCFFILLVVRARVVFVWYKFTLSLPKCQQENTSNKKTYASLIKFSGLVCDLQRGNTKLMYKL